MPIDIEDTQQQRPKITPRGGEGGFAPLPDEGGAYVAPKDNPRGPLVLMLAIVVLAVFGVVVWNAYRQGVRESSADVLPQIASEGAFKSRPLDPGGRMDENVDMEVLHQGKPNGDDARAIQPAKVREELVPLTPDVASASLRKGGDIESKPRPSSSRGAAKVVGETGKPVDLQGDSFNDLKSYLAPTKPTPKPDSGMAVSAPAPVVTPPKKEVVAKAAPKPPPQKARVLEASDKAAAPSSPFAVQLASVQDLSRADGEWNKAADRAPDLFLYAYKEIETADLGAKGVWHRILVGGFMTRDEAKSFCNNYKDRGGDCIVKAR